MLFLHGDEDKIVPPNQAETMHAALVKKGVPTALRMYEGEQHGFRKAENIQVPGPRGAEPGDWRPCWRREFSFLYLSSRAA